MNRLLRNINRLTIRWAILAALILLSVAWPATAADTLVAGKGTRWNTAQKAIDHADSGDVVLLKDGVYNEHNVTIKKPLTLGALNAHQAVIDGQKEGFVLKVLADSVTVRDLKVQAAAVSFIEDYAAILLENVSGAKIINNVLRDNFFGIYLAKTKNSLVRKNDISTVAESESSSGNAIHLWYCKNITVEDNHIDGHRDGIYFEFVEESVIRGNLSENCLRYGLHFMYSDNCTYTNNTFQNNSAGVAVMYTENVEMAYNLFKHNWGAASYGLLLKEIYDSSVHHNTFVKNTTGIYTEASNRVDTYSNRFLSNGWGIKLMANSMDNTYRKNNFIGNTFDVSTNSRKNFNEFNNNYWSHYEGYDLDRDGTGDVPYRPVRLFSVLVEKQSTALMLLHSPFIDLLDTAERIMPVLTPETLVDENPQMQRFDL